MPSCRIFLAALCVVAALASAGCALHATTDFGPGGDAPARRSVSAGAGPFPNLFGSDRHASETIAPPPTER